MKGIPQNSAPTDYQERQAIEPVICYPPETLPPVDKKMLQALRNDMALVDTITVPPRDARTFTVPQGHIFRIVSSEGSQVGDLNLFNQENLDERFYTGKTRALHGTHLSTYDRMWSNMPYIRPLATISYDTLDWYGFDEFGGSVHDVIGTRCDPYTGYLLNHDHYHYCCHSNLTRAMGQYLDGDYKRAETLVHDVLNVFMCTGFTQDTHQYFMKASPVRPGDYIEFFAEVNLVGALSACPGGDCSTKHSSDEAACYPLVVEIYKTNPAHLANWIPPKINGYNGSHAIDESL